MEDMTDEVVELIFRDLKELRADLERSRAVSELTQEMVYGLKKELQAMQKVLSQVVG